VPTPSLALEVQRGSIPGAPNATGFSGGFIFKRKGVHEILQCQERDNARSVL